MFYDNFTKPSRNKPLIRQIRELQKYSISTRNNRPSSGFRCINTPFGTATLPGSLTQLIAFTTSDGITATTQNADGLTVLGTGTVNQAYPNYGDDGTVFLSVDTDNDLPVFNLSGQAVDGNAWVIVTRVYNLLIVTFQACPVPT